MQKSNIQNFEFGNILLFDPKKFTEGQDRINQLLKSNRNTHIFKQFQTESGLVVEIGTWGKKSNESI